MLSLWGPPRLVFHNGISSQIKGQRNLLPGAGYLSAKAYGDKRLRTCSLSCLREIRMSLVLYCNNNREEQEWVLQQQRNNCQCLSVKAWLAGSSTMYRIKCQSLGLPWALANKTKPLQVQNNAHATMSNFEWGENSERAQPRVQLDVRPQRQGLLELTNTAAAGSASLEFDGVTAMSIPCRSSRALAGRGNIVSALRQRTEWRFPLGPQCVKNLSPSISHASLQPLVTKGQWGSCSFYQEGFKDNVQAGSCQYFPANHVP